MTNQGQVAAHHEGNEGMSDERTARQETLDEFYWSNGKPCCAGCDWWRHLNSMVGECRRSAPVAGQDRWEMIGIFGASLATGAGHIATLRDHHCGDFKDDFDWSTLPLAYRRRIGAPVFRRE